MIDHCIKLYTIAQRQEIYKIYVSDALRIIAENTAKFAGGSYIKKRYIDLIESKKQKSYQTFSSKKSKKQKEDKRTAQEIIDDVVNKAGIKVVKSE